MPNRRKYAIYGILCLVFIVFILATIKGVSAPQPGDENVYYYMGKLVSEGKTPYKDFFLAHPPLHVYVLALIFKLFGFNIIILKLLPLAATLTTAFFIFQIAKEKFGPAAALFSSALFLFSYSVMFNSVFSFGIEIAAMFLIAGFFLLLNKKMHFAAGLFFGLAGITRLLSIVPFLIISAVVLFSSRKNFLRLSSGFLTVFLLVNGLFILMLGDKYFTPVYKFHLLKALGNRENLKEYADILKLNWILFFSASLSLFLKDKKPISALAAISAFYLIFLTALRKIFGFYFMISFPFLAIIGGHSIASIFKNLSITKKWRIFIVILLFLMFMWDFASNALFLEKIAFQGFARGTDLMSFIKSASSNDTMLFGDDSVVPLLALLTDKRIVLDVVDTNNEVYLSGVRSLKHELAQLKGKNTLFILRSKQGISYFGEVRDFLNRNCSFLSQLHDELEGDYLVYKCV